MMEDNRLAAGHFSRREMLKTTAGVASAVGVATLGNLVRAEEANTPFIHAYAGPVSCEQGEAVDLFVSTSGNRYAIEVARLGAQRKVVYEQSGVTGARHETPADAAYNGCRWPKSTTIPTKADWPSGYYQVLLKTVDGATQGEAFFIVRSKQPGTDAKILIQLCTNTYNAYNSWGGANLYGGSIGPDRQVSFERPYAGFEPGTNFTNSYSGWHHWEEPFVKWAESAGYKLDFAANLDLEYHPELLRDYHLVLSIGHDEYWSWGMRDNLESFIGNGGNAAFFSGNTCFWQVRPSKQGLAIQAWKTAFDQDPVYKSADPRLLTGTWTNKLVGRPENQLTGVSFAYGGYHRFFSAGGDGCYTVHYPDHWMFTGTGLKCGDRLGEQAKIVGYECDGCLFEMDNGLPTPTYEDGTPKTFQVLGSAPAQLSAGVDNSLDFVSEGLYGKGTQKRVRQPGAAVLGSYTKGGTVVTTGCTEWVRGLEQGDWQVDQITRNVLDRLSKPS
jgi:hypothetical protein